MVVHACNPPLEIYQYETCQGFRVRIYLKSPQTRKNHSRLVFLCVIYFYYNLLWFSNNADEDSVLFFTLVFYLFCFRYGISYLLLRVV